MTLARALFSKATWVGILLGAVALSGCSSMPHANREPNSRMGLFQRLAELEPTHGKDLAKIDSPAREVRVSEKNSFRWPLEKVEVTSPFGKRSGGFHEGVDLRAPKGTPVYAAGDGVVAYAGGKIRGYGRMVVIKHPSGVATIYAHNSKLLVLAGQKIKQGQKIAVSGATGHASGPHLHFEIREGVEPLDPLSYMPDTTAVALVKPRENLRRSAGVAPASTVIAHHKTTRKPSSLKRQDRMRTSQASPRHAKRRHARRARRHSAAPTS